MGLLKNVFQLFQFAFVFMIFYQFVMFDCASGRTTRAPASKPGTDIRALERVPIGVIFDQDSDEIQNAFKVALAQHTNYKTRTDINFQVFVDLVNTADVFKLSRLICNQFARGVVAILAAVRPDSFETFHSYVNAFEMPFVVPFFPVKVRNTTSGMPDYAVSMLPDYHKAVLATVNYYGWQNVIYLYDSDNGLLRLEQLMTSMMPSKKTYFRIANTRKINNASEVIAFLKELEKYDQWSNKYVILDCTTTLAQETLMSHLQDLTLGRRNYHYLLSGLVLDDLLESNFKFNAINITGFKLVDTTRKYVKDFLKILKVNYVSATAALMYDAAHTVLVAYEHIYKQKPHIMRELMNITNQDKRFLSCDVRHDVSLMYGDEIIEFLKKIELEGLTGKIRFSNGVRKDFSLMVFRNSPGSGISKIATWYDNRGFRPVKKLNGLDTSGNDQNKTYTVVSIEEPPYFTTTRQKKNKNSKDLGDIEYGGFCADLAILIAEKLGIKIQFRLVADGKYGGVNPKVIGGWDGMVGELSRKEVDMVIAPLIVTREREAVIDFSNPFLSFNRINEKSETKKDYLMSLLRPLSKETWILLASSMILVSVVMYIVSRFSPKERRIVTVPGLEADEDNSRQAVINEFSFFNSVWYVVSSIMQQGSHVSPRSLAGKIISIFWWFFTLIIVCSYTAYLASQLTVNSISSPQTATYNRMAHCPEDMDGNNKEEIIVEEEEGYGNLDDTYIPQPKDYQKPVKGCEMLVSVVDPGIKDFAVGFAKGSRLRTNVNVALTIIREEGELKRLLRKHFQKTSCELTETIVGGSELTLQDVVGLFYILVIGLVIALLVALVEFCKRYRSDVDKSKVPIKTGIDTNSRLQVNEIQETRDTTRRRRRDQERWNGGDNTPGSYAGLNVPCSSPCTPRKQNVRCIGVRRGMTGQRSHPVVDEAEAIAFQTYFTPNSSGPEEAALRYSYTQV